jgi:flagellar motor protein MotB
MKVIGITSTAILYLLLGIAAPAYAQQEQHGEKQDHPKQQQSKHEQAKPEQQHARQQQRQEQNKQQQHAQQQQRQEQNKQQQHAQQQRGYEQPQRTQEQQRVQQSAWQQHRSQRWDSDHRTWQQRGGYHGYRIPDDRFRGYFGQDHGFRIYGLPFLVVGGYPRFQYEGYWFSLVDPWPEYWANDWYDTDDVYVNYVDNGYYLFDRRYPQQGIAISISM